MKYYIHYIIRRVAAGLLFAGSSVVAHAQTQVGVDVGLRTDYLRWNIADPFGTPNILSELTWENVDSQYLNAHATFRDGNFNVRGDYGYGRIIRGDNQDSDYAGNNRTSEFSRSNNKSNGDHVSDAKLGVGIELKDFKVPGFQIIPWVGLSRHQQNLKITDGFQTIPALGAEVLEGLNSSYEAQWNGPWVGIKAQLELASNIVIRANFEHHWVDYAGQGNWNLRECLAHPKSFTHNAEGNGNELDLSADVELRTDLILSFRVTYSSWVTDAGTSTVHLPADFYTKRDSQGRPCIDAVVPPEDQIFNFSTRLNEVKWQSRSYLIGISMRL